jgi:hypothetical protein
MGGVAEWMKMSDLSGLLFFDLANVHSLGSSLLALLLGRVLGEEAAVEGEVVED